MPDRRAREERTATTGGTRNVEAAGQITTGSTAPPGPRDAAAPAGNRGGRDNDQLAGDQVQHKPGRVAGGDILNAAQRPPRRRPPVTTEAKERTAAMTDLYSGIARGLQICGGYGGYSDITKLMADYDIRYLDPPQYVREFTVENLNRVKHFAEMLIDWQQRRGPSLEEQYFSNRPTGGAR
ncbi:MAG: hypothetical protein M3Y77_02315 [Actinomycetota bacterium]|nr:hypothetical protein [Actinomycetota bacterium]